MKSVNLELDRSIYKTDPMTKAEDRPPEYPTTHLEFKAGEGVEIPKDGTITFKFHLANKSEGDKRCSYTIDLKELVSVTGEKDIRPSKRDTSAEDALDKLAKEKSDDNEKDY